MSEQTAKNPWSYFAGGIAAGLVFTTLIFVIAFLAWIQPTYEKQTTLLTQVSQQRDACIEAQNVKAALEADRAKQGITLTVPLPSSR
jgi:hypothetical protein